MDPRKSWFIQQQQQQQQQMMQQQQQQMMQQQQQQQMMQQQQMLQQQQQQQQYQQHQFQYQQPYAQNPYSGVASLPHPSMMGNRTSPTNANPSLPILSRNPYAPRTPGGPTNWNNGAVSPQQVNVPTTPSFMAPTLNLRSIRVNTNDDGNQTMVSPSPGSTLDQGMDRTLIGGGQLGNISNSNNERESNASTNNNMDSTLISHGATLVGNANNGAFQATDSTLIAGSFGRNSFQGAPDSTLVAGSFQRSSFQATDSTLVAGAFARNMNQTATDSTLVANSLGRNNYQATDSTLVAGGSAVNSNFLRNNNTSIGAGDATLVLGNNNSKSNTGDTDSTIVPGSFQSMDTNMAAGAAGTPGIKAKQTDETLVKRFNGPSGSSSLSSRPGIGQADSATDATLVAGGLVGPRINTSVIGNNDGFLVATGAKKQPPITSPTTKSQTEDATLIGGVGMPQPTSPIQDDETAVPGKPLSSNSNNAQATSPNSITSVKLPISFLGGMGVPGMPGMPGMQGIPNNSAPASIPNKFSAMNTKSSLSGQAPVPQSPAAKPQNHLNQQSGSLYEESSPTMDLEAIQKLLREDTKKKMRAIKDFAGTDGSQLSIKAGDILFVQTASVQNGMVKAKIGGKEGLVPMSYLQDHTDMSQ